VENEKALLTRILNLKPMPDKVHCAHILVKTEQEAKTVVERLNKGEKFSSIAKEVSQCPSGKRGGDLGTFTRGKMVKEFETAAFALQRGQTSLVVKTKFGYHATRRLE
jgi:peptidyl-prolyl cis-trans isomerase C